MAKSQFSNWVSSGQIGPMPTEGYDPTKDPRRNFGGAGPSGLSRKVKDPRTGGYVSVPVTPPNPGEMDEYGNRWMPATGKFEPPNMFADLNWDYGLDRVGE